MTRSSQQLQAIPTEYRGVRFRSKSEAVLARALDLYFDGQLDPNWQYEPFADRLSRPSEGEVPARHNWDFGVWLLEPSRLHFYGFDGGVDYRKTPVLLEYKPSRPTRTYAQALRREWQCWKKNARVKCRALIVYGSPWESAGYRMDPLDEIDEFFAWGTDLCDLLICLNRYGEEAAKYRFDLDSQS